MMAAKDWRKSEPGRTVETSSLSIMSCRGTPVEIKHDEKFGFFCMTVKK